MKTVNDDTHIDNLTTKATAALVFLRQYATRGSVRLDIDDHPDAREMLVQVSSNWVGVMIYNQAGRIMPKLSQAVYERIK